MQIEVDKIRIAYRKLKQHVYYDKSDLRLRAKLAAFECGKDFDGRLETVQSVLSEDQPWRDPRFQAWVDNVHCRLVSVIT